MIEALRTENRQAKITKLPVDDYWIFRAVVDNTKIPDKDAVGEALEEMQRGYKKLRVPKRDRMAVINMCADAFYGGDRVGQVKAAERICSLASFLQR